MNILPLSYIRYQPKDVLLESQSLNSYITMGFAIMYFAFVPFCRIVEIEISSCFGLLEADTAKPECNSMPILPLV